MISIVFLTSNPDKELLQWLSTEYRIFRAIESFYLLFLGAKTTCKDRWRQVLNEANRIERKHLFTLQQGISRQQLEEMYTEGITLVVPAPYISTYPEDKRKAIWTLKQFIDFAKTRQSTLRYTPKSCL